MRVRGVMSMLGAAALAASAYTVSASPAGAATVARGDYLLSNVHGGGCATTTRAPRGAVLLGACGVSWSVEPAARGYTIAETGTTNCMAPSPQEVFPPRIATDSCAAPSPHEWTFASAGHGAYRISAVDRNSRCLAASGGPGPLVLLPCTVGTEEDWTLTRVS